MTTTTTCSPCFVKQDLGHLYWTALMTPIHFAISFDCPDVGKKVIALKEPPVVGMFTESVKRVVDEATMQLVQCVQCAMSSIPKSPDTFARMVDSLTKALKLGTGVWHDLLRVDSQAMFPLCIKVLLDAVSAFSACAAAVGDTAAEAAMLTSVHWRTAVCNIGRGLGAFGSAQLHRQAFWLRDPKFEEGVLTWIEGCSNVCAALQQESLPGAKLGIFEVLVAMSRPVSSMFATWIKWCPRPTFETMLCRCSAAVRLLLLGPESISSAAMAQPYRLPHAVYVTSTMFGWLASLEPKTLESIPGLVPAIVSALAYGHVTALSSEFRVAHDKELERMLVTLASGVDTRLELEQHFEAVYIAKNLSAVPRVVKTLVMDMSAGQVFSPALSRIVRSRRAAGAPVDEAWLDDTLFCRLLGDVKETALQVAAGLPGDQVTVTDKWAIQVRLSTVPICA
jgi:hypothetical protein